MKALITGASSGMGHDMALILSKSYDELILVGRNEERLVNLKEELTCKSLIEVADLSDYNNCIKLFNKYKDIDLLINNAGFGDAGLFDETSLDKDINMINTNITALHTLTKLYLKEMKERNSGHILNVASIAGFLPGPLMATYYATKNYVVRLSEAIYRELKKEKSKVKISILCPGPVNTNFEKNANVKFKMNGLNSYKVASYTLKHLNKFYIVPGFGFKMMRIFSRFLRPNFISKYIYKMQKRQG